MGELDEKEVAPNTDASPTTEVANDEPKETEKLLQDKKDESEQTKKVETPKSPSSFTAEIEKLPGVADDVKRTGEEIINIPDTATTPKSIVTQEGREVKPKKIPIGGIKMPGFFTKNKPKGEGDGADGELLDNAGNEAKAGEAEVEPAQPAKPAEKPTRPSFFSSLRIRNPFARRQTAKTEEEENKDGTFLNELPYVFFFYNN